MAHGRPLGLLACIGEFTTWRHKSCCGWPWRPCVPGTAGISGGRGRCARRDGRNRVEVAAMRVKEGRNPCFAAVRVEKAGIGGRAHRERPELVAAATM